MILKSLLLKNIRSYTEESIRFPRGTTLFEGDVGSGKTTILMAVEFALFGLGSEKGGGLLRTGTKEGSVKLQFEVDGEDYEVFRALIRKGKGVQQSECWVKTSQGILKLSASEMKEKVLELLNFNEPPDPKAQSLIYRYAVFTPQEEMKAILWMHPDSRLQTLRKAFRIEGYRIAVDNASNLNKLIKNRKLELEASASDIEEKREKRKEKIARDEECKQELGKKKDSKKPLQEQLGAKKEEKEKLRKEKEELAKAVGEVPLLAKRIEECQKSMDELEIENEGLQKEVDELKAKILKLQKTEKPTMKTEKELEEELEKLREQENSIGKKIGSIEQKIDDYESIKKNKMCPTCDRPAEPKEFEQKISAKTNEQAQLTGNLSECRTKIEENRGIQKLLNAYQKIQTELQHLTETSERNKERLKKNRAQMNKLGNEAQEATEKLEAAKKDIEHMNQLADQIKKIDSETDEIDKRIKGIDKEISSVEKEIEMLKKEIEELSQEIAKKEQMISLADKLGEYEIWLDEFFIPTLDTIEKHVMLSISQEFNQQFQKWFTLLIEDTSKDARIDEEFTPIIEQDGYEQNTHFLSGGEKTSLALAYRLALNNIVQKVSTGMKSNLLILDEPTDGFSKEQLFKIREILDEIKCPQVIVVSHERELESFADQIWNVKKVKGVSRVT